MIFRKFVTGLIAVVSIAGASAQSNYNVQIPQILPASPEATAFIKAGFGNVNMSTGGASANIPLYTIKLRDYTFPISLSYSNQGLKADEYTPRVGVGWNLNATGMITRVVKGKPDEYAQRLSIPADFSVNSSTVFSYESDASDPVVGGDSQADEFQFNVNGISGKFVLDSNYVPRVTSTTNVQISIQILVSPGSTSGGISQISLTAPDGVKYQFGNTYEKTATHNILQYDAYKNVTKTSFFLDKITLPTGEYINFSYTPIYIKVITGMSQRLQIAKEIGERNCGDCMNYNLYSSTEDKIEYNTNYLSSISVSDGRSISLTYESRGDSSKDNRLKSLEVPGLKKYLFDYYNVPASPSVIDSRFFLTKIRDLKNIADVVNPDSSYDYEFTYHDLVNVPLPVTFSQDYLGFYNGNNKGCLIPTVLNSNNTIDFSFREPLSFFSKKGSLLSIKYPTGGTEEFIYEANTQMKSTKRNTLSNLIVQGAGASGTYPTYNGNVTIKRNGNVILTSFATDADPNDYFTVDSTHATVVSRIYEGSTMIASRSSLGYKTDTSSVYLYGGHTYRLELTVKDASVIGNSWITYDSSAVDIYDTTNAEIPGLRVRQIKSTDPVSQSTHSKYYTYAGLNRLDLSTGSVHLAVDYHSTAVKKTYCMYGMMVAQTVCGLDIYSSSSTNEVYNSSSAGNLISYSNVIESDDPNFVNGGTEYVFQAYDGGSNKSILWGQDVPYLPSGQYPTLTGELAATRVFDANKSIVQEELNEYETQIDISHAVPSIYVRKGYDVNITYNDWMSGCFDVIKMLYGNYWIRLKSKTTKVYSGATVQIQKTDYTYGTTINISPIAVISTDSKGGVIKTENKYPTDFPGDATYQKLVAKNIISPLVLQSSYRNDVLLQQKKTLYKDWFNDSKIIMPEIIQLKETSLVPLHDEFVFTKYDKAGNPLALRKTDDIGLVYLWDSIHVLPVCEVKNANADQVAYTGFEDGIQADGNWYQVSGTTTVSGSFTGLYGFSGTLTKTISTSGVYSVNLWTNSSVTVNGASGTIIKTARGWNYYEWTLTNPSTITVTGTNIDELKLCPKKAILISYTYFPYVGISSISDQNGNVVYYEYDSDNRLFRIRDVEKNIIKQISYKYQVYGTNSAVWQTTGQLQCKPCPSNGGYITNIQQHQEKDINSESATYNTFRWVDDGVSASCVVTADWQNTGASTCEQSDGVNTGYQLTPQKDMNPCSSTYNNTRSYRVYNPSVCPLPCSGATCSGIDKKCINGVCVTGTRINTSSVYMKNAQQVWIWRCTYHYLWSDSSVSPNYTEDNSSSCPLGGGEES